MTIKNDPSRDADGMESINVGWSSHGNVARLESESAMSVTRSRSNHFKHIEGGDHSHKCVEQ